MKTSLFASAAMAASNWSTANNKLYYKGQETVLHGFSTTCTEYLLRGIGEPCWANYQWNDHSNIITNLDYNVVNAVKGYFQGINSAGVKPALRVPMTASSWLGIATNSSQYNMNMYPNLGGQYQTMIKKIVEEFTNMGAVVVLDLHWNNDDAAQ